MLNMPKTRHQATRGPCGQNQGYNPETDRKTTIMIRRWRIRNRILLLTMLPATLIALILGGLFIKTRLADLDNLLVERGLTTARQLAVAAEFATYTHNREQLLPLTNAVLEEPDIRAVAIYDSRHQPLVHAGPRLVQEGDLARAMTEETHVQVFSQATRLAVPVRLQYYIPPDDLSLNDIIPAPQVRPIGWIILELSHTRTRLAKYQTLVVSLTTLTLGWLLCWFLAVHLSRNITKPIHQIVKAVTALKENKLETRIHTGSGPELQLLEDGINAMAESLGKAYDEMQQNIEQATEDLRETLETIEIQNIELDMARKEALEASRIKSEFLANMSHEIRTPLNGIIGFTNLLLRSNVSHQQRDHLKTIQKSSEILLTIINDILDFSKIEAGKLVLDRTPFQLREIIEDVLTMLAPAAHQKNLDLAALVYSDVPKHILGDPLRVKQIITNLVNNGIKFTQSGEVVVRAMVEEEDGNKVNVKVSVTDTGVGLSRVQQQSLFTAFSQADASTARRFGGTGLGLVISKRLIEQMGGQIGLESELGKGSTFWFSLPTEISEATDDEELPPFSGERVIYLENQPKTGLAVGHMLEDWGIELDRVDDPVQMLERIVEAQREGRGYALAILGIHRHLLDSTQYKQLVSELEFKHNCRVLLLTPTLELGDKQLPLIAHCSAHLTKPPTYERLYRVVQHLITGSSPEPQQQEAPFTEEPLPLLAPEGRPRILAVDDNSANLKLAHVFLTNLGAETDTASSGFEALSKIKQRRYDLIFMDVQMPGMDGVETTLKIRQLENGRHTPIIALTAHALAEEKEHLLKSGFDDYLTKPIAEAQLIEVILHKTGHQLKPQGDQPDQALQEHQTLAPLKPSSRAAQELSVDIAQGVRLAGNKPDLAEELFCMLLDHLDDDYEAIRDLWRDNNRSELLERVHKLHGATRYCGVPLLRNLAGTLESELKQDGANIQASVEGLLNEIERIRHWAEHHDWQTEFRTYDVNTAKANT